jgi:hypothetical protein
VLEYGFALTGVQRSTMCAAFPRSPSTGRWSRQIPLLVAPPHRIASGEGFLHNWWWIQVPARSSQGDYPAAAQGDCGAGSGFDVYQTLRTNLRRGEHYWCYPEWQAAGSALFWEAEMTVEGASIRLGQVPPALILVAKVANLAMAAANVSHVIDWSGIQCRRPR